MTMTSRRILSSQCPTDGAEVEGSSETATRSPRRWLRYRDGRSDDWADIIDFLRIRPDARRRVVRSLGEVEAP
jgi:hypothetical protein